jgi:hypothetical protein
LVVKLEGVQLQRTLKVDTSEPVIDPLLRPYILISVLLAPVSFPWHGELMTVFEILVGREVTVFEDVGVMEDDVLPVGVAAIVMDFVIIIGA